MHKMTKSYAIWVIATLIVFACGDADCSMPRDELESYAYHDLDLVGTIKLDSSGAWVGCFRLPDRSLRLVKTGSYIGKNSGKISRIAADMLAVTELKDVNHGELIEDTFFWPMQFHTSDMGKTTCSKAKLALQHQ